ncbi:MAG TPA: hypothetical protein VNI61_07485 [Gemmatimonadales bacterium]|nr:hypothetical protein [Gemmatimonadales bacterium]
MCRWHTFVPGLLATGVIAVGCRDSLAPDRADLRSPALAAAAAPPTATGLGGIGNALALPGLNRQEFDFAVSGAPDGRFFIRDYSTLHTTTSLLATMTADSKADPATGITSFAQTSARCVSFGGIGRVDTGDRFAFSVDACDHGSPGAGLDWFSISVPAIGYHRAAKLTDGDITLTGLTLGDIHVTAYTTGTDLDADGYAVTLNTGTSRSIGTHATVQFDTLPEGTYTVALGGLARNCVVSGANPRTLTVVGGRVSTTTFDVACADTTPGTTRATGLGVIGDDPPLPKMNRFELDFEATSELTGRVRVTDYAIVRGDGEPASMIVDPAADPATGIEWFTRASAACVSFGGVGRLNDGVGSLYRFVVEACDRAAPGAGADTFSINLPDRPYAKSGTLSQGDIAITTF